VDLPEGNVTFVFSDVEGSTQLLERHTDLMGDALARHHAIFEAVVPAHRGVIFETIGDAVYAAFADAADAVAAALNVQLELRSQDWGAIERIACRIAVHGGDVVRRGDHYFGAALFRCSRLQSIGYGEQILLSAASADAVGTRLPTECGLIDLGEHRLKDLADPEHVFMLVHPNLRSAFPPPKSIDLHPNNLPSHLTALIGREDEMPEVVGLVRSHRLVVLTGPGGIGKTRLALAVAAEALADHPHGTFFVGLANARHRGEIPEAIADVLGIARVAGDDVAGRVASFLAQRPMLLVLDNLEQIAEAGIALLPLLEAAPQLRLLVTSRTPLRVRGERVVHVRPLESVAPQGGPGSGVSLFIERASQAGGWVPGDADLPEIGRIVERVDGLPLAIELAAARTRLLSVPELVARLGQRLDLLAGSLADAPDRHQTLRATVRWSYDLLVEGDRRAFRHMAIFSGGATIDAASAVLNADLDTLGRLVDSALVIRDGSRLRLLETVHDVAAELLEADSEAERRTLADRHARWYREWLARLVPLQRPWPGVQLDAGMRGEVSGESANLSQSIEWFLGVADVRSFFEMALRLWEYWLNSGRIAIAEAWFDRALELNVQTDDELLCTMLGAYSEFPRFRRDAAKAIRLKERAVQLARELGDETSLGAYLHDLAALWADLGDIRRARLAGEESYRIRLAAGGAAGITHSLDALGDAELRAGDPALARGHYEQALRIVADAPDRGADHWDADEAYLMAGLALSEMSVGDRDSAVEAFARALILSAAVDDAVWTGVWLEVATILVVDGNPRLAARLLGVHEAHRVQTGVGIWYERAVASARQVAVEALGNEQFDAEFAGGRRTAVDDARRSVVEFVERARKRRTAR
jgi:predicted ATPase/class 3 adenylate cyclase